MSARKRKRQDDGPVETWPVAQSSALAAATQVAMRGMFEGRYGYMVVIGDDIRLSVFIAHEPMRRALAREYTRRSLWAFPSSWEEVLVFTPTGTWRLPKARRARS